MKLTPNLTKQFQFRLEEDMSKGPPFDSRGNKNQNNALTALARKGSKYESARSPDLSSPSIPGKKIKFLFNTGTLISKADKIILLLRYFRYFEIKRPVFFLTLVVGYGRNYQL